MSVVYCVRYGTGPMSLRNTTAHCSLVHTIHLFVLMHEQSRVGLAKPLHIGTVVLPV